MNGKVGRIISLSCLLLIVGGVVVFLLMNLNVIDNPYDVKPNLLSLSQNELRLKKNASFQLETIVYPNNASNRKVIYESSNSDIVSVNQISGYIETKKNGTAIVTAKLEKYPDIKDECVITVSNNNIPINKFTLNTSDVTLQVNNTFQLTYKVSPQEATLHEIVYVSSNNDIATVSQNGLVKGIATGTSIINVSDKITGINSNVKVTVKEKTKTEVKEIKLSKRKVDLNVNGSIQIKASVLPKGVNQNVTWSSLNNDIATVKNGVITGKNIGKTKVVAAAINGVSAYVDVNVIAKSIKLEKIKINEQDINMNIGETRDLSITFTPSNATNQKVTWDVLDSEILDISNGKITAKKDGSTEVVVTSSDGNLEDRVKVTVVKATKVIDEQDIKIESSNININVGASYNIKASVIPDNATYKTIEYESTNPNIVSVGNTGLVVGKSSGNAKIILKTVNKNITKEINVTVNKIDVTSIKLNTSNETMIAGNTLTLVKTIEPSNATDKSVKWQSSDPSVATVDNNGLVKALKKGTTNITVETNNNSKKASCTITVKEGTVEVRNITLNQTKVSEDISKKVYLNATIDPSNASNQTITWESSDNSIATVSDGVVVAKKKGVVTITAISSNGKRASCEVTFTQKDVPLEEISFDKTSINLEVGKSTTLKVKYNPTDATNKNVSWSSSNDEIVSVVNGKITANKIGSANITAKSSNNLKATIKVNVTKKAVTIKVASINLGAYHCGTSSTSCQASPENFANLFKKYGINIVGMQESEPESKTRKIPGLTNLNSYFYEKPASSNTVISNYAFKSKKKYSLPSCYESRIVQKVVINVNNVDVSFYNSHFSYQQACHDKHFAGLKKILEEDNNPIIVVGDLNINSISYYNTYLKPLGFVVAAYDTSSNNLHKNPTYCNAVYVKGNNHITVKKGEVVQTFGTYTDHNMTLATLEVA